MIRRRWPLRRRTPLARSKKPIERRVPLARSQQRIRPTRPLDVAIRLSALRKKLNPPTHRQLVVTADRLWRFLVYAKEPLGICPRCGIRWWHDAAHGFPKGPYPWLRFEIDNGLPLCRACHTRVDSDFHAKVTLWKRMVTPEAWARLELRAQAHCKTDVALTIVYLRQEYQRSGLPLPKGGEGARDYCERAGSERARCIVIPAGLGGGDRDRGEGDVRQVRGPLLQPAEVSSSDATAPADAPATRTAADLQRLHGERDMEPAPAPGVESPTTKGARHGE